MQPATSMMLPFPFVPHPGLIPSAAQLGQLPQQFPSPNSAFSPVVPRGPTPGKNFLTSLYISLIDKKEKKLHFFPADL